MKNVGPFPKITGVYMHMFLLHLHVILQFLFICFLSRLPLDFALLCFQKPMKYSFHAVFSLRS